MRAALLHNLKSGAALAPEEIMDALEAVGWRVKTCVQKSELDECVASKPDVVVAAGGDGTIARVARRLAGTGLPMAIVPMGTANNIARSLGIGVDPSIAIAGLARAAERQIDLGAVEFGGAGPELFVESFGLGLFADVIGDRLRDTGKTKKLRKALTLVADELETYEPRRFEITGDGRNLSGAYLLVAVMNMRSFGPALGLAPSSRVDDGRLDLVLVRPESREALIAHLRHAANDGDIALPAVETTLVEQAHIRARGKWAHIDDRPHEVRDEPARIRVRPETVLILQPTP
jgi:diacylglycerol kinase family enzyme